MRRHLRALRVAVSTAFEADPKRAGAAFAVAILSGFAVTLTALWLKMIADGVARDDTGLAIAGAVAVAVSLGVMLLAEWTKFTLNLGLNERTGTLIDQRLIALSAGVPGIEHHERPEYIKEMELLRRNRIVLAQTAWSLAEGLSVIVRAVMTGLLLAAVDPVLLLLPAFAIPSMFATAHAQRMWHRLEEERAEDARVQDHLFTLATTAGPGKELRIFGLGDEIVRRFDAGRDDLERAYLRARMRGALFSAAGWTVFAAGFVGAMTLVVSQAVDGRATVGDVILTLTLAAQVNQHASAVVAIVGWMFQSLKAVGRYLWLTDYARDAAIVPDDPAPAPDRIRKGIDLERVSFHYPGTETEVLRDVSLHIPAAATVAIVGDNGAGKSTLVKLLCRFYEPSSGTITVDGVALRRIDPEAWRARMSAGFQDFGRFELLARENVGIGSLAEIGDGDSVTEALVRASATDVIDALPAGLETQLGKTFAEGVELSGGQWQKLALGRAMMREAPLLLVLDEPTASLDAQTEHALFERYAGAARDAAAKTGAVTVLVSHRFSTVRMADLIVVVDGGRLVEVGSHAELMALQGLYAELYELQARAYR